MLTGSRHCSNQHHTTNIVFFQEFEKNWAGKSLPWSDMKSWDCLLAHWPPITAISVAICRISATTSSTNILKTKDFFWFLIAFLECSSNLKNFEKKRWASSPNYYRNYWLRNSWLHKRLKGLASEHHSVSNVLTSSRHCSNHHDTTILVFFHAFQINWVGKSLPQSDLKS